MPSKCLIVGMLPDEMKKLFDYMPLVELDLQHPAEHLLSILNNFENYISLIEKNYSRVLEVHTWKNRWKVIEEIIEGSRDHDYELP